MLTLVKPHARTLTQQDAAGLLWRIGRAILIALATLACACLAGGMADG